MGLTIGRDSVEVGVAGRRCGLCGCVDDCLSLCYDGDEKDEKQGGESLHGWVPFGVMG